MSDIDSTLTSVSSSGDEALSGDEARGAASDVFGDIHRGSTFASRDELEAAVQAVANASNPQFRVVANASRLGNPNAKPGRRAAFVRLGCAFRSKAGEPVAVGCQWQLNASCQPPLYDEWCVNLDVALTDLEGS